MAEEFCEPTWTFNRIWRMTVATLLHGIGAGVVGILCFNLIASFQYLGFGADKGGFLVIAEQCPVWRRMLSVCIGGIFGAVAWFWLRGRTTSFVPVSESMNHGIWMPPGATIMNAMVQDIVVAFGGSFGREAAPREVAAMWGGLLGDLFKVTPEDRRILVACGTGAGLAAVYSVPISGALYTIEHILDWEHSPGVLLPAIATSIIACAVSYNVVETDGLYHTPYYGDQWPTAGLLLWSILIGPIAGYAAAWFCRLIAATRSYRPKGLLPVEFKDAPVGHHVKLHFEEEDGSFELRKCLVKEFRGDRVVIVDNTNRAVTTTTTKKDTTANSSSSTTTTTTITTTASIEKEISEWEWDEAGAEGRRDWVILIQMPAAFFLLALLCSVFPTLLGNGRALAQVAIFSQRSIGVLCSLFLLKMLTTAAAIASGVDGGTLTPSVALGATLGAVLGSFYQAVWESCGFEAHLGTVPDIEAMALIAAAAFLGAAMKAPVTGLWLLIEFGAQGMKWQDVSAILHGPPAHSWEVLKASKLAIGMILPMAIAMFISVRAFKVAMKPSRPTQHHHHEPEPVPAVLSPVAEGENESRKSVTEADGDKTPKKLDRLPIVRRFSERAGSGIDLDLGGTGKHADHASFSPRADMGDMDLGSPTASDSFDPFGGDKKTPTNRLRSYSQMSRRSVASNRSGVSRTDADDLDLGTEYYDHDFELDVVTKAASFYSFRAGVMLNTAITVAVAAAVPPADPDEVVTQLSLAGVAASAVVGLAIWLRVSSKHREQAQKALLASSDPTDSHRDQSAGVVGLWAAAGAVVPLLPWTLKVYDRQTSWGWGQEVSSDFSEHTMTALACSALSGVLFTACAATMDAQGGHTIKENPNTGLRQRAVAKQALTTLLLALGACVVGLAVGKWICVSRGLSCIGIIGSVNETNETLS